MEHLNNIGLFNHFLSKESSHLTPSERLVALGIAKHRNNHSMKCCPSVERLVEVTGLCEKTIRTAIKRLIKCKEVVRLKIKTGGFYTKSQYYFHHDFADAMELYSGDESNFVNHHDDEHENFEFCIDKGLFAHW